MVWLSLPRTVARNEGQKGCLGQKITFWPDISAIRGLPTFGETKTPFVPLTSLPPPIVQNIGKILECR